MPYDWQSGDRCKVRPVFTLPASTRSHWKIRSPYYYPATITHIQHLPRCTLVIVELDDHAALNMGDQLVQASSLFALHTETCRCRRCRHSPHDHRAEAWQTRARRRALASLHGIKRAAAWCGRCIWAPKQPASGE